MNGTGLPWKNGTNELCWRDGSGRPPPACKAATACLPPPPPPAPPPAAGPGSRSALRPPLRPPPPPSPAPTSEKVTFAADAFFDFDKSVLKPEGKAKLDDLVSKMSGMNLEVIIAVGHTDSVGTDAYNQKLSVRRAEAVKAYLVSKGSRRTASTPKARARSSLSPTTRPPKAARRTVAWKSKWSVPARK